MHHRTIPMLAGLLVIILFSSGINAHHSFSAHYDPSTSIEVSGTVVEMKLVNPHSRIVMNVENANGATEVWLVEMNSYNGLRRQGWKKTDLKPGDRITIKGEAGWDGKQMVHMRSIEMPDGKVRGGGRRRGQGQ